MSKRIYVVKDKDGEESLVKVSNKSSAIRAVAEKTITAAVATQDDLMRLAVGLGKQVSEPGEDPTGDLFDPATMGSGVAGSAPTASAGASA